MRKLPIVVYRSSEMSTEELAAIQPYFRSFDSRTAAGLYDVVIARYSALPFYQEQVHDYTCLGASMINSYREHRFVADIGNYTEVLAGLTPRTWRRIEEIPPDVNGPFVLKGETNSRKFQWNTHFFAKDRHAAGEVLWRLQVDGLGQFENQHIYIRQYVPLDRLMDGVGGIPISREFRLFYYRERLLASGFYWSNYSEDLPSVPNPSEIPTDFLKAVVAKVAPRIPFYVVDVAKTADGQWIVIELNDAQMSGLSMCSAGELWSNLSVVLKQEILA